MSGESWGRGWEVNDLQTVSGNAINGLTGSGPSCRSSALSAVDATVLNIKGQSGEAKG